MKTTQKALRDATLLTAIGLAVGLALLMAFVEVFGDAARRTFALHRAEVLSGEIWRMIGAHLVNLSPKHTYLNIAGLGLICATLWPILTGRGLARAILMSGAVISVGLLIFQPADVSYVGFSGITHGVFAFGGLVMAQTGPRWFSAVVLGCLLTKIGYEAWVGPVPGANEAIKGTVSVLSHSLGALGGSLAATGTGPLRLTAIAIYVVATASYVL
ncbi:rhombosortase [Tateyamaria sp. SN3-11]|uniref:rhombosortase n=1 Tax=Tateyamaria sp. SN3-11 TaxID=3092147 RepID=UPI0039ED7782